MLNSLFFLPSLEWTLFGLIAESYLLSSLMVTLFATVDLLLEFCFFTIDLMELCFLPSDDSLF